MQDSPVYLTPEGREKIAAKLAHLRDVRRPEAEERVKSAREISDLDGNPEYDEAKGELSLIDREIRHLENLLEDAVLLVEEKRSSRSAVIKLGSEVLLLNEDGEEENYRIVSRAEADPRKGLISNESPIGKALLGHKKGDRIETEVPDGTRTLKIVKVK